MSEPLAPELAQHLEQLNSANAYDRITGIKALAETNSSDARIVTKLSELAAADPNRYVRDAAARALQAPANQALLEHDSTLAAASAQMTIPATIAETTPAQAPTPTKSSGNDFSSWGIYLIIAGVIACALPFFGYKLMLLRFIDTENPLCGIGLIVGGVVVYALARKQS